MTPAELSALNRLIHHTHDDTPQARHVSDFLLAWWNAPSCGGFNLAALHVVDDEIGDDMQAIFAAIQRTSSYPPDGYNPQFRQMARKWRPELSTEPQTILRPSSGTLPA